VADHVHPSPDPGPNGRLIVVGGRWSTGAGLTAAECVALPGEGDVHPLTDPTLWGREITDERYLVQT
jgi:NAD(P)H-hydrate repair Nnr-like enzyme with NAD(P)H-hydrate dehydratase domain